MSAKQPRTRKFMAHEPGFTIIDAMNRVCGGAAFSKHMAIARLFCDAQAGASWRRRAMFCANSSAKPFWEYRCSEREKQEQS